LFDPDPREKIWDDEELGIISNETTCGPMEIHRSYTEFTERDRTAAIK
jgi:hypothetical protein